MNSRNAFVGQALLAIAVGTSALFACSGQSTSSGSSGLGGTTASGGTGESASSSEPRTSGGATAASEFSSGGASEPGRTALGGASSAGAFPSGGASVAGGGIDAGSTAGAPNGTPLPALKVVGTALQDDKGKAIVLRGSSLMDIGTLFSNYNGMSGVATVIDKVIAAGLSGHMLRLPVYPKINYNGNYPYCSPLPYPVGTGPTASCEATESKRTEADYIEKILKPIVDYVTSKRLYVIIDYHQIDNAVTGTSAADANTFWTSVAPVFANYSNVLYEPFNEPIDARSSWAALKPIAQGWIDTIRASAPNNIIIVPSPLWAQLPGDAASNPPVGTNLVYTAHVYPGNWKAAFMQQVEIAVSKAPVFITEWGYDLNDTSNKTTGTTDSNWGPAFRAIVDANGASWTAWVLDNSWQPKLFANNAYTTLTDFGTFTKDWLAEKAEADWVE